SNGGAVLQINLHDVLQTEASAQNHSFDVYSATAATATATSHGPVAQWLLDQQMQLNPMG
ncbi:MAG: hypothetical protein ACOVOX_02815, partial [Burkholderiaceae bacterium]